MVESKIVEAVGVASGTVNPKLRSLAKVIQEAMTEEVKKCLEEEIPMSNTETYKTRMEEARQRAKDQWYGNANKANEQQ